MRVSHISLRRSLTDETADDALAPFVKTIAGFEQAGARGVKADKSDAAGRTGGSSQSVSPQDRVDTKARARQEILPKSAGERGAGRGQSQEKGQERHIPVTARTFANFTLQVPDQGKLPIRLAPPATGIRGL